MNNPTDILSLENFWNDLKVKYPLAVQDWCDWCDTYKEKVNWKQMFGHDYFDNAPKIHELPIALQIGLFIQYQYDGGYYPGMFEIQSDWKDRIVRFFAKEETVWKSKQNQEEHD